MINNWSRPDEELLRYFQSDRLYVDSLGNRWKYLGHPSSEHNLLFYEFLTYGGIKRLNQEEARKIFL